MSYNIPDLANLTTPVNTDLAEIYSGGQNYNCTWLQIHVGTILATANAFTVGGHTIAIEGDAVNGLTINGHSNTQSGYLLKCIGISSAGIMIDATGGICWIPTNSGSYSYRSSASVVGSVPAAPAASQLDAVLYFFGADCVQTFGGRGHAGSSYYFAAGMGGKSFSGTPGGSGGSFDFYIGVGGSGTGAGTTGGPGGTFNVHLLSGGTGGDANGVGGSFSVQNHSAANLLQVTEVGNVVVGSAALATTATDGFLYIEMCAGTPTGVPTAFTGRGPVVIDSTNHLLYFYDGTWRPAGTGTVTSVAMTVPSIMSIAGSPVTTSGTLAVTLATQVTKTFLAGPTSGADAAPTFRAIAQADLPTTIGGASQAFTATSGNLAISTTSGSIGVTANGNGYLNIVGSNYSTMTLKAGMGTVVNYLNTAGICVVTGGVVAAVTGHSATPAGKAFFLNGGDGALASAFTDATGTLAATALSSGVLIAGRSYAIHGMLTVSNTTATEGAQFDFNGGTATATAFRVIANNLGTNVAGTVTATALNGVVNWTTVTGTDDIIITGYIKVNAGGTVILRCAENSHTAGTLTLAAGSWLKFTDIYRL